MVCEEMRGVRHVKDEEREGECCAEDCTWT
jgi:hypothetical protein